MSDIITSGYTNVDQVIIDLIIIIKILLNAASESDMITLLNTKIMLI